MNDARILIVEDNDEVAQMLALFLGSRGFKVSVAPDGGTALQLIREVLPHLILLDIGLPDIDGYELLREVRRTERWRYIPTIFLTQRSKKADRLAGLQLGADDFISKPFDLEELFLRVQNSAARADRENLSNPNTGLPTGRSVREAISGARGRGDRAVLEFRLRHTSEFRDMYGALAGADLLRYTALLLNRVLNMLGAPDDFLGQLDEDTFILISSPDRAEQIGKTARERFGNDVLQHYNLGERAGDQVRVKDSAGRERLLPLIRLEAEALN